ncbi:hypothetical protein PAL_GLEAN10006792 [Pteropus alecto]|uniref:Uncharacterized protein n=1 Tax=Pteropus alecto TaxID=9402 RepID=L5L6N9_PTEAL|nr:hypothetical protein PAL_GLEAN10006792 [Pteropus alecto]
MFWVALRGNCMCPRVPKSGDRMTQSLRPHRTRPPSQTECAVQDSYDPTAAELHQGPCVACPPDQEGHQGLC